MDYQRIAIWRQTYERLKGKAEENEMTLAAYIDELSRSDHEVEYFEAYGELTEKEKDAMRPYYGTFEGRMRQSVTVTKQTVALLKVLKDRMGHGSMAFTLSKIVKERLEKYFGLR